jgi:hypothetical protein
MNEITVGRSPNNTITLTDNSISNYHAKFILKNDGTLWVKDLNSTNGTFVNGVKIEEENVLNSSDTILLGLFAFDWQKVILSTEESVEKEPNTTLISSDKEEQKDKEETPVVVTAEEVVSVSESNEKGRKVAILLTILLLCFGGFAFMNGWFDLEDSDVSGENDDTEQVEDTNDDSEYEDDKQGQKKKRNKKNSSKKVYNIECLDDGDAVSDIIEMGNDIKKTTTDMVDVEVTIKEEDEVGQEVKSQVDKDYSYSSNPKYVNRINKIIKNLLKSLGKTKYQYKWYVIKGSEINAFTAGGYIFITTGIINFAQSDDELACVIGHEIYHNELGHIREKIKEQKIAKNMLGDELGDLALIVSSVLSTPFNQENEAYCDLYGLDLAFNAGYNGCAATSLWDRMSKKEKKGNEIDKLFRSHPYSSQRSSCIHHHVETNYKGKKCKN